MFRNLYDDEGEKHGYWEEFDDDIYLWKGYYEHGEEVGTWRTSENGVEYKSFFEDGMFMSGTVFDLKRQTIRYCKKSLIDDDGLKIHIEEIE